MTTRPAVAPADRALLDEEAGRAAIVGRALAFIAGSAFCITLFLGGHPQLRWGMLAATLAITVTGLWASWSALQGRYGPRVYRVFLVVCTVGCLPIQAYLGVFSAAPIAVTLGISFFAASDDRRAAMIGGPAAVVGYLFMAVPMALGIVRDPGLMDGALLSPAGRLFFVVMVPMVQSLTIWHAWRGRSATRAAVHQIQQALDEADHARERAELAGRAKSEFLTNMSHEIRTPMNGILGISELLQGQEAGTDQRVLVGALHRSALALLGLLDDILDVSSLETGRLELRVGRFDLHQLIDDVAGLFQPVATAKGLDLRAAVSKTVPRYVEGDALRIRQVLANLVGNALKFTDFGGVVMRFEAGGETQQRAFPLRAEVEDSGIGIPADKLREIFGRFYQIDAGVDRRHGGTGLGLTISSHLVRLMGGDLGVRSELGSGAVFWFELPLLRSVEEAPGGARPLVPSEPTRLRGGRLLVVEDHEVNRLVLGSMLEVLGYTVDFAGNGVEALRCAEARRYDAILMDCQLPELDGYATTRELRRRRELAEMPIIGVSAHAFEEHRDRALASGMNDYLVKPVEIHSLTRTLDRWLERSPALVDSSLPLTGHLQGVSLDSGRDPARPRERAGDGPRGGAEDRSHGRRLGED